MWSELNGANAAESGRIGIALAQAIDSRRRTVLVFVLLVTIGLAWPMVRWVPEGTASQSPETEVTRAQELVAARFADDVFRYFMLVEATSGDILDKAPLLALLENTQSMREQPEIGDLLVELRDPALGIDVDGTWTVADAVDRLLTQAGVDGGLAGATEEQVDDAVTVLLATGSPIDWGLATGTTQDSAGVWRSPALFHSVATDNTQLGGGGFLVAIGTDDLQKEEFARTLRRTLEGDGSQLTAYAPAADVNLTSTEQGELAGPFIGLTIAVVLLIVGIAFRSYWAVAVAGAALGMLMVWLRGGANLIGLENDQILNTILPISMISFGIDSAFHGIGRVREEARRGRGTRRAFVVGLGSVFGALALAASSDMAAFLSNTAAGIESVVQFGLAAALATAAAFLLLGVATPLVLTMIEDRIGGGAITRFGARGEMILSLFAAALATAAVLVLVFISAPLGLGILGAYLLVALLAPLLLATRHADGDLLARGTGSTSQRLGKTVKAFAAKPWLTLLIAGALTGVSLWGAFQLQVTFDVKDFFSPDSDFVVALDKTAEYLGEQGGEPVSVYVETDLTAPGALDEIRSFISRVSAMDGGPLARDPEGRVRVEPGVVGLISDLGDGIETAGAQALRDGFVAALNEGVADNDGAVLWTPNAVGTVLWHGGDDDYATVLTYQIPDTRDQTNVVATRQLLEPIAADLEASLQNLAPESDVVVTGSAVFRDDQLAGIRRSLLLALPIAVVACFALAAGFMRSLRYAAVTIIPILLVVTWLFGIMHIAGYSINVVTAIIAAVSIGIGIDFSTHFAMRFIEESASGQGKLSAVAAAGTGTGSALAGSALTSVAGFGVLAFAPMPMFATYGILTAVMIVLALIASLLVLPSLLVITTKADEAVVSHRTAGRVVDLRAGQAPAIRLGLGRDLSDGVVATILDALENVLRSGDVVVRTVPGPAVAGLVADGSLDLGIVSRWPHSSGAIAPELEELLLRSEHLVAVGGAQTLGGDTADIELLTHALLVAGPTPEAEEGVLRLLGGATRTPVLAHTVADVSAGLRLAKITGGAMILPASMAIATGLPVRPLAPELHLETVLLATRERSADPSLFQVVLSLSDALGEEQTSAVSQDERAR